MNTIVYPAALRGTVAVPASKSEVHRLLICAALADRESVIRCEETNRDIDATAACLRALGAAVTRTAAGFSVTPIGDHLPEEAVLPCGESGSTLRFLLPVCAALGVRARFLGEGRLPQRPLSPLYELLADNGCALSPQGSFPLCLSGRLKPGDYAISGAVSSQFISGLLMALPLLEGGSRLTVTGKIESAPYITMTRRALADFSAAPERQGNVYTVRPAVFRSRGAYAAGGDWSGAAFWLCAGAMGGEGVTLTGLAADSPQGDRAIADVVRAFGGRVDWASGALTVRPGALTGVTVDVSQTPDLVPAIAALACAARGETHIVGAARLRLKESDRLEAVTRALSALGARITQGPDSLTVAGGPLVGGTADAAGDHRIAMMAAVAAQICAGPVTVLGSECIAKSYPRFFDDLRRLGGRTQQEG